MYIYLPIAEMSVNIFIILLLGGVTGILSGMFGVGGGFLTTPFLIFMGIPPAIAVSSSTNQTIASSFSGFMAHLKHSNVDIKMGLMVILGGLVGSALGVSLFVFLKSIGHIDIAISICYLLFLGSVGIIMAIESAKAILHKKRGHMIKQPGQKRWVKRLNLPFKIYFPKSNVEISVIFPIVIGVFAGILVALMGIGGGFVMIPAMIYILGMPTSVVIGTSLFQIMFITSATTFLQASTTYTVDIVLALLMLTGSVIGAQFGTKLSLRFPSEQLRAMLAIMILGIVFKLFLGLVVQPDDLFTITKMN